MNSNSTHLLKRYALPGLLLPVVLFGVIMAVPRGDYVPLVAIGVAAVVIVLVVWNAKRSATKLFQNPTPEPAVAHYRSTMPKVPNGTALCAYMCGLAYTLYGEYDKARDELGTVSWSSFPPMYDGCRTSVLSMIALLEKRDARKALDLAQEARDLCEVDKRFPGAATTKRSLDAQVFACQLLIGSGSSEIAMSLEASLKQIPSLASVIPSWSLMQYYRAVGNGEAAERHSASLKQIVPYCNSLFA